MVHEIHLVSSGSLCIHLNQCAELLSKRFEGNFQIYLEWSWQLMSLDWIFQQLKLIYLFIFKVTDVDDKINWINE